MSKKVDQHFELLDFLATRPNGVSYEQLMREFRCSRKTVYSRLLAIRSGCIGALEEKIVDGRETLFFLRKSLSRTMKAASSHPDGNVLWSLCFCA